MPDHMPPSALPPGSNVWAYLRDSGGPSQEQSIPQQEAEIRSYCRAHNLALVRIFSDVGKSGGNVDRRAQFQEMIDLSRDKAQRPAALLVWNFARFSRDVDDSGYYKALLRKRGVKVISITDPIPEGEWARVVETIIDISNEEKRRQNSRDVKRALENLVSQGYASGGRPPRGYKSMPVTIGMRKDGRPRVVSKWEPDPALWELVQLAWQMRAQGKPYGEITRATRGKVYKSKNCWITFFSNRTYLGIGKCGDKEYPDHHAAVVTQETWDAVQEIQRGHARTGLRDPRHIAYPSLLAGLAYCSECGAAMVHHAARNRNWPFYVCGNHDRRKGIDRCKARRVGARKLEGLVLETVLHRVLTPEYFEALRQEIRAQLADTAAIDARLEELQADHRAAERAVQNLLELAESFGAETVLTRIKQKDGERARLAAEIFNLKAQREALQVEVSPEALAVVLQSWCDQIIAANHAGNILALRSLLSRFVQRIDLSYKTAKLRYTYPINSSILSQGMPPHGGTVLTDCMAVEITLEL